MFYSQKNLLFSLLNSFLTGGIESQIELCAVMYFEEATSVSEGAINWVCELPVYHNKQSLTKPIEQEKVTVGDYEWVLYANQVFLSLVGKRR